MNKFIVKPGDQSVTKTFRLPEHSVVMMEQFAKENILSLNNLVVQCLESVMDNLKNEEK